MRLERILLGGRARELGRGGERWMLGGVSASGVPKKVVLFWGDGQLYIL